MQYKRASKGTMVNGDPTKKKKVTKESVYEDMVQIMGKEFPDVAIPEEAMKGYAMTYLLSGLRPEALDQIKATEKKRQRKGLPDTSFKQ